MLKSIYQKALTYPKTILVLYIGLSLALVPFVQDFSIDASLDSLSLENDQAVTAYTQSRKQFGSDDEVYLILNDQDGMLNINNIDRLKTVEQQINQLETIKETTSVLNVPIFKSNRASILSLMKQPIYLSDDNVDIESIREDLLNNPIYQETIISKDAKTTSFLLKPTTLDQSFYDLEQQRRSMQQITNMSDEDKEKAKQIDYEYQLLKKNYNDQRDRLISDVNSQLDTEAFDTFDHAYIGGGPVIIHEIIQYLKTDMQRFALGVLGITLVMLTIIFKRFYWSVVPMLICTSVVTIMIGFLGWMQWDVTVVTANFPALLYIITLAMMIHIIIHMEQTKHQTDVDVLNQTLLHMFTPCFYTTLTTIVGFASLISSQIRPIMDLGIIMSIGLIFAFTTAFLVFPACMKLLHMNTGNSCLKQQDSHPYVLWISQLSQRKPKLLYTIFLFIVVIGSIGISRLTVDNRFIDYFMPESNVHASLEFIDNELGGTIPLEIILTRTDGSSWLSFAEQDTIKTIHKWLDSLPSLGKVVSLHTLGQYIQHVTNNRPVSANSWNLLTRTMPLDASALFIKPFISDDGSETRILVRVPDSDRSLKRNELYIKIQQHLTNISQDQPWGFEVTGLFVLYNNMLQSLFQSQIMTIGVVYSAIWFMFIILFRSISIATIAIIPNLLPVIIVLGLLGWLNIPLDMMTIMIAAITLGLSVDFAIHYIHRFRVAFKQCQDYEKTIDMCNNSIGTSIFYMTLIFVLGFSIFLTSNFLPSIYFGCLTALAVFVSFFSSLTLLPMLLSFFQPLKKEA